MLDSAFWTIGLRSAQVIAIVGSIACSSDDDGDRSDASVPSGDGSPSGSDASGTDVDAAPGVDAALASCAEIVVPLEAAESVGELVSDGQILYARPPFGVGQDSSYLQAFDPETGTADTIETVGSVTDFVLDGATLYYANSELIETGLYRVTPAGVHEPIEVIAPEGRDETGAFGIAVDDTHVYFSAPSDDGGVRRVPREGGTFEQLADDIYVNALYVRGDHVYWHQLEGKDVTNEMVRVAVAGGPTEPLYDWTGFGSLAFGNDGSFDTVCWADREAQAVRCGQEDGGGSEVVAAGQGLVRELVAFDGYLYWLTAGGVNRTAIGSADPVVEEVVVDGDVRALTVDGRGVYYAANGAINRVPLDGCPR